MESVKLPKFSGDEADFDVWKMRFKAFAMTHPWGPAITDSGDATVKHHGSLYANLVLSLPEDQLAIIEDIGETNPKCGYLAWAALIQHYEDDGIYRCAQLLEMMDLQQPDDETSLEYLNRLVRLQKKLARVGEVVTDRRVVMHLVKGLKDDYASITDTWDVTRVTLDRVRKDLLQKGKRVESRKGSKGSDAAAFNAQSQQVLGLEKQVQDLQAQLARLQHGGGSGGGAVSRRTPGGGQPSGVFRGRCYHCGEVGHRRPDCPARKRKGPVGNAANADGAVAFPACVKSNEVEAYGANVRCGFGAALQDCWLSDTGASDHMTAVKEDFSTYQELNPQVWVKGICASAVGIGSVVLNQLKTTTGDVVSAVLHDVLHVPELSNRAGGSYHRLFSLTKACARGHRLVLEDPVDYLELSSTAGCGLRIPLTRALGLIWLPAQVDNGESRVPVAAAAGATLGRKSLWHARLGHLGESCMTDLLKADVDGLGYLARDELGFCESCAISKSKVNDIPRAPAEYHGIEVFEVLGIDFEGPMGTRSLGGCLYSFAAVCFKSRFILHDSLRSKTDAPRSFRRMLVVVRSLHYTVRRVRVDNDSVLLGSEF